MYEAPKLELYGTFRELTQGGGTIRLDGGTQDANDGCESELPNSRMICTF